MTCCFYRCAIANPDGPGPETGRTAEKMACGCFLLYITCGSRCKFSSERIVYFLLFGKLERGFSFYYM